MKLILFPHLLYRSEICENYVSLMAIILNLQALQVNSEVGAFVQCMLKLYYKHFSGFMYHVCLQDAESMSAGALSELYDELDEVVRELSEELILSLARRDELEYEKELKNQFIALLLSIQRRQRELIDSKRRSSSSAKTTDGAYGGNQPGCVSLNDMMA